MAFRAHQLVVLHCLTYQRSMPCWSATWAARMQLALVCTLLVCFWIYSTRCVFRCHICALSKHDSWDIMNMLSTLQVLNLFMISQMSCSWAPRHTHRQTQRVAAAQLGGCLQAPYCHTCCA